jgi:hypothetical protein
MATSTYTPLATTTLGSAAASYTFSSIPATYTDLILVYSGSQVSQDNFSMQFNSDTATNYSVTTLYGDGTNASSQRFSNNSSIYGPILDATTQSNLIVHIQNYSNTTTYKTILMRGNSTSFRTTATVGLWRATPAAITTIKCQLLSGGNFNIGTTFSLYGIKAA